MTPDSFPQLWARREEFDALFGERVGRSQSAGRRIVSAGSRATVRLLFGGGVADVNTPYRLIRAGVLREIVEQIPPDAFAPNVIISGALARAGLRICNLPVPFRDRCTGSSSLLKWRLWGAALKSFWQTLTSRPRLSRRRGLRQTSEVPMERSQ
jgi:hypothetical protein